MLSDYNSLDEDHDAAWGVMAGLVLLTARALCSDCVC